MQPINLADYEALAETRLDRAAWDYYRSGAEDELTLRENRAAFARIALRPRVLVDVSRIDMATTVLGAPISMPIFVAPTAMHCMACEEGERDTARAAGDAGTAMVVSTLATRSIEEVAAVATGPLWFQLYVYKQREISAALVRRAEAAGYRALVLTVDAPRIGTRERDVRNGFGLPPHLRHANFTDDSSASALAREPGASALAAHAIAQFDQSLTWEAVDWLRGLSPLPVVVKGILTAEDARLAVEHGVAGIVVSNHGGRQLDTAVASIEALPEVVEAVGGRCVSQFEHEALAFKNRASDNIAVAVPQGSGGDPYHMYMFFSGLGGYIFGHTKNGALNPSNIGIANKVFLKNAGMIDKWNREGLINSKIDYGTAKNAWLKQKAAFWITGPWETDSLKASGNPFKIIQLPKIMFRSVPFLGVQGMMVTKFATVHGVESLAKDLVANEMMKPNFQLDLEQANQRFPANLVAGRHVNDPVLKMFGAAGVGGVPMPNIPQMGSVWADLGSAWVKSTKGPGSTPARVAFTTAAANIRAKIAGG